MSSHATSGGHPPALPELPPELALRIAALLDPQSLLRFGRTCAALHAVARAETLWRDIVLEIVAAHGQVTHTDEAPSPPGPAATPSTTWYDQAKMLLPFSHHLGYFASSMPYSSRVVRVAVQAPSLSPQGLASPPPQYWIRASQVLPRNLYDNPLFPVPGDSIPYGSSRDPVATAAYIVQSHLNLDHPYSGLSVDLLEPVYDCISAPMFDITSADGPCLARGNSATQAAIAAAASRRVPPRPTAPVLRLQLDPVTQRVERNQAGTHPEGSSDRVGRDDFNREALFALFSGRLPRRQWPTLALVGLEEVNTTELPALRAGLSDPPRNTIRLMSGGGGAFRGLAEYLTQRRGERPLAKVVQPRAESASTRDDEAFVTGFRLRAKRTPRVPPGATARAEGEHGETSASAGTSPRWAASDATRRRGVGGNGGPAVLWHGREEDPDDLPQVTILRAGDEGEGGFVLRMQGSPPRRRAQQQEDNDQTSADGSPGPEQVEHDEQVADSLADTIDSMSEAFFPIKAPARPIEWDDPSPFDEHGEVYASSLEGLWLGTYGGHGLEFVHLSTGFIEMAAEDVDTEEDPGGYDSSDSEGVDRRVQYRRVVTATKVTGDPNVPSGQTSWVAVLTPSSRHSHPLAVTVPSISISTFRHLSSLDPLATEYQSLNNGAGPDWSIGTARAYGRIALTGFANPSWTGAQARFLRHEVTVQREGKESLLDDTNRYQRTVESVEEIHLRWDDLQKVGVFRRVRV